MPQTTQLAQTREQRIISLLHAQDKQALVLLYEHYSGALYNIILRIVPQPEIAEEVLQDAYVKIWRQGKTYDPTKGKLFTWMARVVRNLAIDRLRSKNYKTGKRTESIELSVDRNESLSETLYIQDSGLRKVVEGMDEKYKQIIDYLYFRDYTQSETSKELGIPLGTVKSRSRLAIKELRKLLRQEKLISIVGFLSQFIVQLF